MQVYEAQKIARKMMDEHGLSDWVLKLDRCTRRMGGCSSRGKYITLSVNYIATNNEHWLRDTVLHEIAHAFTPNDRGHGAAWRNACRKIGAKPIARPSLQDGDYQLPLGAWVGHCPTCHRQAYMFAKPRGIRICRFCHEVVDFKKIETTEDICA